MDRIVSPDRALLVCLLVAIAPGCQLLQFFEPPPASRCEAVGATETVPCGPCLAGEQDRECGENLVWRNVGPCTGPYDHDGDGYPNSDCRLLEQDTSCCGVEDCDDDVAERFPGAHPDLDGDGRYDSRCCDDDPLCDDCDDDDDDLWNGHADRDGDEHDDVACGGDDCDDDNVERWNGHADADGDGHTDARCCLPDTPMCDDCDDDDPLRWTGHADLDGDGHAHDVCGGDDCDDDHPMRWIGNADVDGDGRQDDRCCPGCAEDELDCNDDDPLRWTGNSDLDGDGFHDSRCRCDPERSPVACELFTDCDDDCASCFPGGELALGEARDHDCNWMIDELEQPACVPDGPEVIGSANTGCSQAVAVVGARALVGALDGLYEVDVSNPESPEIVSFLDMDSVSDVALWADLVLVTNREGLTVVRRRLPEDGDAELIQLAGPVDTGFSRRVQIATGLAYVASYDGVYVVDMSAPEAPVIIESVGEPLVHDVSDVLVANVEPVGRFLIVVSRTSSMLPDGGGYSVLVADGASWEVVDSFVAPGARNVEGNQWVTAIASDDELMMMYSLYPPVPDFTLAIEGINRFTITASQTDAGFVTRDFLATDEGLIFGRFVTPIDPIELVPTGPSYDVEVSAGHAYVASEHGLMVVRLSCGA